MALTIQPPAHLPPERILLMWAAGSHRSWSWGLGIANQALWFAFIVAFGAWGLLPLNVALVVVYSRNLVKWRREREAELLAEELAGMDDPLNGIPTRAETRAPLFPGRMDRGTGASPAATPVVPLSAADAERLLLPSASLGATTERGRLVESAMLRWESGQLTLDEVVDILTR